ncbi:MAG TPA: FHA domain-containing protein [Chloroflexota bacterium]|nr:FHA domain-containing protein [Chloroflexota bacterium]
MDTACRVRAVCRGSARTTILQLTTELTILALRVLFLAILYLFLLAVVVAVRRDVSARAAEDGRGARLGRLVVLDPGQTDLEQGDPLELASVTRLGRSGQNTIVLDDSFVSAEHAVIVYRDGGWWLTDQGSMNGTLVNESPVRGEVALAAGDVIGIGSIRLRVTR